MEKKMEKTLDRYSAAAILLYVSAILFVAIPLFISFGDFATAAFVISGMAFTILGSFVIMFSGNEPVDPRLVGILPVQASLNLCRIASDSGITGNAYFLPPHITGESRVMQFNPESSYYGGDRISARSSFTDGTPHGLVTVPAADILMQELRKRNALVVPDRVEELTVLISETISEVFEFAPQVTTTWHSGKVTITLHEYRFIEGCLSTRSIAPLCCTRYPCPVCSLCGTLITECTNKVVALEECSVSVFSDEDITAVFSFS